MPIRIQNGLITGGKVGISLPHDSDAEILGVSIDQCETGIEVRDPIALREAVEAKIEAMPAVNRWSWRRKWNKAVDIFLQTGSGVAATAIAKSLGIS